MVPRDADQLLSGATQRQNNRGGNAFSRALREDAKALERAGEACGIVCPECGGRLWRMKQRPLRYRCHVGHVISAISLFVQQGEVAEAAGGVSFERSRKRAFWRSRFFFRKVLPANWEGSLYAVDAESGETSSTAVFARLRRRLSQ
jgi:DNA-directed RNA polymerase subunit RPC12/RpoP